MSDVTLPSEIRQMSVADRLALAEQLWESIVEDEGTFELTESQQGELAKRLAARAVRESQARPWEDVRRDLIGE